MVLFYSTIIYYIFYNWCSTFQVLTSVAESPLWVCQSLSSCCFLREPSGRSVLVHPPDLLAPCAGSCWSFWLSFGSTVLRWWWWIFSFVLFCFSTELDRTGLSMSATIDRPQVVFLFTAVILVNIGAFESFSLECILICLKSRSLLVVAHLLCLISASCWHSVVPASQRSVLEISWRTFCLEVPVFSPTWSMLLCLACC